MTNRERFINIFNFKPVDRVPVMEWAVWWRDKTIKRWEEEGLPVGLSRNDIYKYFDLDDHYQYGFSMRRPGFPAAAHHGAGVINDERNYDEVKKFLFPENAVSCNSEYLKSLSVRHDKGEFPLWFAIDGYFWHPRNMFGIENHLYSFYDQPELYNRICSDAVDFQIRTIEQYCEYMTPDYISIAEDMSYNHGPMLSKQMFDEFLAPHYKRIVPVLKQRGIKVFVDTDGDVTPLIPWLLEVGIDGIFPLERQAGVDVAKIREDYPDLLMIGGYDKLIMKNGEAAMRAEFERLLPVMKKGGYIASVDHQTPPDVSLENYKIFVKLFKEYSVKAGNKY